MGEPTDYIVLRKEWFLPAIYVLHIWDNLAIERVTRSYKVVIAKF